MAIPTCRSINSRSLFLPELVFKIPRGPSKRRRNPKFFYGMAELNVNIQFVSSLLVSFPFIDSLFAMVCLLVWLVQFLIYWNVLPVRSVLEMLFDDGLNSNIHCQSHEALLLSRELFNWFRSTGSDCRYYYFWAFAGWIHSRILMLYDFIQTYMHKSSLLLCYNLILVSNISEFHVLVVFSCRSSMKFLLFCLLWSL